MNRKILSLLSLLLIFPLTSPPAFAAGAATEKEARFVATFCSYLTSLLEMGRWTIDPNGVVFDTTDGRSTIDPDGVMAPAAPASGIDGRSTIDPNG